MLPNTSGAYVLTGETACLQGKHVAVNPHKQRLLVAANKAAKLPKAKPKATAKAVASGQAAATLGPEATAEEPLPAAAKKGGKPRQTAAETGYSQAKKKFLAE